MAAEDHMKNAANELHRAGELLKQEIAQLRTDETRIKQMVALQLTQLQEQVKMTEQQISSAIDGNHTNQLKQLAMKLQKQINDKRQETDAEMRRITDMIRDKQKAIDDTLQQAKMVAP